MRVAVTATDDAEESATTRSAETAVVAAAAAPPPVNNALPTITGTAQVGQLLTANPGSWSGTGISFAFQWERCNAAGDICVAISGAVDSTYALTAADQGQTVRVAVTATDSAGESATARSAQTAVVAAATTPPPSNTTRPTISGTAQVGKVLTASRGTWSGTGTITYRYQWERCDAAGGNCVAISGATHQTYTPTAADEGHTLRVAVTATAGGASATARSTPRAVVAAGTAAGNGCPAQTSGTAPISELSLPAQLQIVGWNVTRGRINRQTRSFILQVRVGSTCRVFIRGASVYVTAVPFNQFSVPAERLTGNGGIATLTFTRRAGFPASSRQRLLTLFIRARNPRENVLRGVTARRLVAIPFS